MKQSVCLSLMILLLSSQPLLAGDFSSFSGKKVYFGAGLSVNALSGFDDSTGFQILLGYPLKLRLGKAGAKTALEFGYMDSGDFGAAGTSKEAKQNAKASAGAIDESGAASGFWFNALTEYPLDRTTNIVGRFGMDIGDDSGFMFGLGLGYHYSKTVNLRGEYVLRDNIDSIQFNLIKDM